MLVDPLQATTHSRRPASAVFHGAKDLQLQSSGALSPGRRFRGGSSILPPADETNAADAAAATAAATRMICPCVALSTSLCAVY